MEEINSPSDPESRPVSPHGRFNGRGNRLQQRINRHLKKVEQMRQKLINSGNSRGRGGPRRRLFYSRPYNNRGDRGNQIYQEGRTFSEIANNGMDIQHITAPVTTSRVTTAPTTSPVITSRVTTSPITTSPVITAPVTTSRVTTAPTTSPVITSRVTTSPITTSPITTSPITTSPITTSPVITSPVTTSPVTTSPVITSPVTTSPVITSPIDIQELQFVDGNGHNLFTDEEENIGPKEKKYKINPLFETSSESTPSSSQKKRGPKKGSKRGKKSLKDENVKNWLIKLEAKLDKDWGYSVQNNDLNYSNFGVLNLDYVSEDFHFINHDIDFDNMIDTLVNQHIILCKDGIYRVAKLGSINGHFTIDNDTGLARIYTTKVKNYKLHLHNIIAMYKVRDDKMNVQERCYVQVNKLLEVCGNEVIDDGFLRNLDNLQKSNVRMLYYVAMTESFAESLENVIRYDEHHINSTALIPKLIMETCIMESIGYEVVPCIPCAAVFHSPHTHQGCRHNVTKRRIRMETLDMLAIDDRALVAEQFKVLFNVDTYFEALNVVKKKIEGAQKIINKIFSSKRVKILCGLPWFRLKDYSHFYKDLDEEEEVYCTRHWLSLEFKTEKGGYCCNRGTCANSDQVVTLFDDLLIHLKEKHFAQIRREDFISFLEAKIIEERANEIRHE